jgi:hypothetical protein
MKKLSLITLLLSAVLLLQNCTKDTVSAVATSSATMFAVINDTTWTAQSISTTITYNAATKDKVIACTAATSDKQLTMLITQADASNSPGFPLNTYNANASGSIAFSYATKQNNAYVPLGTVAAGSGTFVITAIDSVKKQMTGTFSFTALKNNYDTGGNIVSVTISKVADGTFNNMPYSFVSN